jgi:hypothetical protein
LLLALTACASREDAPPPVPAPEVVSDDEAPTKAALFMQFDIKDLTPAPKAPKDAKKKSKDKKDKKDDKIVPAGWHLDYDKAVAQARSTGKPLLVLFH